MQTFFLSLSCARIQYLHSFRKSSESFVDPSTREESALTRLILLQRTFTSGIVRSGWEDVFLKCCCGSLPSHSPVSSRSAFVCCCPLGVNRYYSRLASVSSALSSIASVFLQLYYASSNFGTLTLVVLRFGFGLAVAF